MRERKREKWEIYIVIGWERQTSIFFLANVDSYDGAFPLRFSFWFDWQVSKNKKRESFFFFCFFFNDRLFLLINGIWSTIIYFDSKVSLPVVIEVWSIESMWAVSSVFSEHIMISFSHLFHLFYFMNRSMKQKKIINLELSAFRCQTSII